MSQENRITVILKPADKTAVLKHLADIRQLLYAALLFNLDPTERQNLVKMGDKSLAFVGKALDYATKNPALVPPYLDLPEANKDYTLCADLKELSHELGTLSQAIDDTIMMAGSEAYDAALIFHNSVKGATRTNAPGTQAIYEDLAERFPRSRRRVEPAPAPVSA
jgi:hypothetical protein